MPKLEDLAPHTMFSHPLGGIWKTGKWTLGTKILCKRIDERRPDKSFDAKTIVSRL